MTLVKICGLTSVADAEIALEAGADALGLNFVPGTPRAIDARLGREISAAVAGRAVRYGVFRDASREEVMRIANEVGLDVVQLHGSESPEFAAALSFPLAALWFPAAESSADTIARSVPFSRITLAMNRPSTLE